MAFVTGLRAGIIYLLFFDRVDGACPVVPVNTKRGRHENPPGDDKNDNDNKK